MCDSWGRASKYRLEEMEAGETRQFSPETPQEHRKLCRSAHNYNTRTDMFFSTRSKDGVVYITRMR